MLYVLLGLFVSVAGYVVVDASIDAQRKRKLRRELRKLSRDGA